MRRLNPREHTPASIRRLKRLCAELSVNLHRLGRAFFGNISYVYTSPYIAAVFRGDILLIFSVRVNARIAELQQCITAHTRGRA